MRAVALRADAQDHAPGREDRLMMRSRGPRRAGSSSRTPTAFRPAPTGCSSRPGAPPASTVHALEKFGHDPRFPVSSNWPHLRDELIHFIERERRAARPISSAIRSAASSACWRRRGGPTSRSASCCSIRRSCRAGRRARCSSPRRPASASGCRPATCRSAGASTGRAREAAYDHFASKPAFARWAPGVLRDYIDSGTEPHDGHETGEGSRRLAFSREIETAIYNSLPHHITRRAARASAAVPDGVHRGHRVGRGAPGRPARRPSG